MRNFSIVIGEKYGYLRNFNTNQLCKKRIKTTKLAIGIINAQ